MRVAFYLLSCVLLFSCKQRPAAQTHDPLEAAFLLAKKENKKVFVLITNSQCGQCTEFTKRLDSSETTRRILRDKYICYTVDALDTTQTTIARIVKCPSWPFPYFFNNDGTLEAFGFPTQQTFDIRDLSKIGIDEYRFKELFGLSISTTDYKQMVSLTMRAWLLAGNHSTGDAATDSAYRLVRRSLHIAVYPFNLYLAQSLVRFKHPGSPALPPFEQPQPAKNDLLTYGHLLDSITWKPRHTVTTVHKPDDLSYTFITDTLRCGTIKAGTDYTFRFQLVNTGKHDLVIAKAEHSCSCIELQWPQQPVRPGQKDYIRGVFHATEKGDFFKKIYIHAVAPEIPMKIVTITGTIA